MPDQLPLIIGEIARVMRPQAWFVCLEPCADSWPIRTVRNFVYRHSKHFDPDHERGLRSDEIKAALETCGLAVTRRVRTGSLAYVLLFNSDMFAVSKFVGGLHRAEAIARFLISIERTTDIVPLLNYFTFNVMISARKR